MDRAALINTLQTTSHLRHSFSGAELAELAQYLSPESIRSGATVMRQGEPADSMIFILEGVCRSWRAKTCHDQHRRFCGGEPVQRHRHPQRRCASGG